MAIRSDEPQPKTNHGTFQTLSIDTAAHKGSLQDSAGVVRDDTYENTPVRNDKLVYDNRFTFHVKIKSPNTVRGSIVVSIPACHAEDPGSIPGRGDSFRESELRF